MQRLRSPGSWQRAALLPPDGARVWYASGNCPLGGMVDAADLKSASQRECRFKSGSGHQPQEMPGRH